MNEEEEEEQQQQELPSVCCSFFDLVDASVRAEIEKEIKFIPEYSNYWRCNTQPLHRGQVRSISGLFCMH